MLNLKNPDLRSEVNKHLIFNTNVCKLFERHVEETPYSVASKLESSELSYKELDQKSTTLAAWLKSQDIGSGIYIGVSLNHGFDLLVCILAIFKSGRAYFPIDPNFPKERIKFMVDDAKPSVIITNSIFSEKFDFCGNVVNIDDLNELGIDGKLCCREVFSDSKPDDPAYLIYTSGSMGIPKGIVISYHNLSHIAVSHKEYYPNKIVGLVTGSIGFDISMLTICSCIFSGGTVCFLKTNFLNDPFEIIKQIEEYSVNYLLCVPSFYSMLIEKAQVMSSLKVVSLAGEAIPHTLPELHTKFAPNATLYNEYAPSECACGATIAKIYDPVTLEIQPITIGKPLPNTQIFILDESLEQVPRGAKGEIFIGGMGVALGYLNKSELTKKQFLTFTFSKKSSIRLYRTGDYGRFLVDGNLEFLGRKDTQVKIRGFRVEISEIENAVRQCTWINECAVVTQEANSGTKRLIGFFNTVSKASNISDLRTYLKEKMPDYMIPSILIHINQFPRNANGKIDREALTKMKIDIVDSVIEDGTKSDLEEEVYQIWKNVLQLKSFDINDNFFDLGGTSLNIATVQTMLESKLGLRIPLIDLLQNPSVSKLACFIRQINTSKVPSIGKDLLEKKKAAYQRFKNKAEHA
ncbi:MAG: non-ribosomal peptide synthetase [Parachlamydiales bacterium]|nr:non-ribosomal peptide synthetase [Parachlamydiales bacterium]